MSPSAQLQDEGLTSLFSGSDDPVLMYSRLYSKVRFQTQHNVYERTMNLCDAGIILAPTTILDVFFPQLPLFF